MNRFNISFVLPMYNESANIEETLARLTGLAGEISGDYEIVVVDDASTDGCGDIVDGLSSKDPHIKSIHLKKNTKFGGALKEGFKNTSKEIIVYTDSDLPVKEDDVKKAIQALDGADIITGYSLVMKDASLKRIVMSKTYNFLVRLLFGLKIRDVNSGFKIYKKRVLEGLELKSMSPFVDVEVFVEAIRRNFRIKQYGLVFELRTKGSSSISRPSVVLRTFRDMLVYKFSR